MAEFFGDAWTGFVDTLLSILPDSPLRPAIDSLADVGWLHALNWLVPVGTLLAISTVWLSAIAVYYIWQAVLRWAKVIGG